MLGRQAELRPARSQPGGRGAVRTEPTPYEPSAAPAVTSCYGGALVRYRDGGRTVTVVGSADFMTNCGLLQEATPRWR